jgi:hypothetical protein
MSKPENILPAEYKLRRAKTLTYKWQIVLRRPTLLFYSVYNARQFSRQGESEEKNVFETAIIVLEGQILFQILHLL